MPLSETDMVRASSAGVRAALHSRTSATFPNMLMFLGSCAPMHANGARLVASTCAPTTRPTAAASM